MQNCLHIYLVSAIIRTPMDLEALMLMLIYWWEEKMWIWVLQGTGGCVWTGDGGGAIIHQPQLSQYQLSSPAPDSQYKISQNKK